MAKDDYFVIVYKILAYLYVQLKAGQPIDSDMLAAHGGLFHINESYHAYILTSLLDEGYIDGVRTKAWGGEEFLDLSQCRITPHGIAYIFENTLFEKAKKFLKDVKDITPFI